MLRRLYLGLVVTALSLLAMVGSSLAKAPSGVGYTLVANNPGSASLIGPSPGDNSAAVQLASSGTSGWGAIGFTVPKGFELRDVNFLSTDYEFVMGSCWGGAPRFTVGLSDGGTKEIYFYMGPPPSWIGCASGLWANTGNLAAPGSPVDDAHLPGGSQADTYSHAQARYGSYRVVYIAIDLDGGWDGDKSPTSTTPRSTARHTPTAAERKRQRVLTWLGAECWFGRHPVVGAGCCSSQIRSCRHPVSSPIQTDVETSGARTRDWSALQPADGGAGRAS